MSSKAYVAIGTNLGDRVANYRAALVKINELPTSRITRRSSLYESEPHGRARNWFLNGVVEVDTEIDPKDLLKALQKIETALGRKRDQTKKTVSRTMDLDILLYDQQVHNTRTLKIPHPETPNRRFVLLPLSELIPAFQHPVTGENVSVLLAKTTDTAKVTLFKGKS